MIRLERVVDTLPAGLDEMRAEARAEGHRMLDTLAAEWESGQNRFQREGEALFAAYLGDTLAGIGGLTTEPTIPGGYRMRRFYVRIACRRSGVARNLALRLLGGTFSHTVTANAAGGSESFWEALGFVPNRRDGYSHSLTR